MKRLVRVVAPVACALGIAACASSSQDGRGVTNAQPSNGSTPCVSAGEWCHFDGQCCSGRCYVDTGCDG
jgi:hypothetical protein